MFHPPVPDRKISNQKKARVYKRKPVAPNKRAGYPPQNQPDLNQAKPQKNQTNKNR
jgi:hypothetical protein